MCIPCSLRQLVVAAIVAYAVYLVSQAVRVLDRDVPGFAREHAHITHEFHSLERRAARAAATNVADAFTHTTDDDDGDDNRSSSD